ncbi:hypothetical protein PPSIR1_01919 [Plesiocystis pacifica SIR-1]|uniref:Uncharacterized protein n=1 Tax=Plesiocystis pacifica SIR-1 TaxID=391625 RepID=A6G896_9BACT|nr:hypothetical protein [Plesiocystis pacifica]EDM77937.1 hypothetical protein PPSIR1_01919 [Plesiocystis pacifica SIR-1]
MSDQARARDLSRPQDSAGASQPAPASERLERVLADIRSDAQVRAEAYARETVVPEGGE